MYIMADTIQMSNICCALKELTSSRGVVVGCSSMIRWPCVELEKTIIYY